MDRKVMLLLTAGWMLVTTVAAADDDAASVERKPDSVYVGTPHDVVARMLDLVKVTKDDLVYDLGCGDGRIVVSAAQRFGCKAAGFDIDPVRIRESLDNVKRNGMDKLVQIERKDIFQLDLRPASVVTLYLLPHMNERLIPQFNQLKAGTRIVAHDYGIKGMQPDKTITMVSKVDGVDHDIFVYTLPFKKAPPEESDE